MKKPIQETLDYLTETLQVNTENSYGSAMYVVKKLVEMLSTPGPQGGARNGKFTLHIGECRALGFRSVYYQAYFGRRGGKDRLEVSYYANASEGEKETDAIFRAAEKMLRKIRSEL